LAVVLNILALQDKPNIRPLSENKENCCKAEQKSVSKARTNKFYIFPQYAITVLIVTQHESVTRKTIYRAVTVYIINNYPVKAI
jgi:hypothetical protein